MYIMLHPIITSLIFWIITIVWMYILTTNFLPNSKNPLCTLYDFLFNLIDSSQSFNVNQDIFVIIFFEWHRFCWNCDNQSNFLTRWNKLIICDLSLGIWNFIFNAFLKFVSFQKFHLNVSQLNIWIREEEKKSWEFYLVYVFY